MACELLIWPIQTHKYLVNITSGQYHASGPKTLKRGTKILQKRSLRRFANGGGGGFGVGQRLPSAIRAAAAAEIPRKLPVIQPRGRSH